MNIKQISYLTLLILGFLSYGCSKAREESIPTISEYIEAKCPHDSISIANFGQSNSANSMTEMTDIKIPKGLYQYDWKSQMLFIKNHFWYNRARRQHNNLYSSKFIYKLQKTSCNPPIWSGGNISFRVGIWRHVPSPFIRNGNNQEIWIVSQNISMAPRGK